MIKFPPIDDSNKRIVLEHTSGKLKGLHSICGLRKEAPTPLPEFADDIDMHDHVGSISLVAVKSRYILYRELIEPNKQQGKNFHKDQQ